MRAADLQTVLSNTAVVQQIQQQTQHRADNVQHQFVLESHVVLSQKQQAVAQPEEGRAAEIHRERDPKHNKDEREHESPGEDDAREEDRDGNDSGCGRILDLRA